MPTQTFPVLNPQVKTTLRWYDSLEKKNYYRPECAEQMDGCRYKLYSPSDSLLPFQLARPHSVGDVTSWKVFNLDGTEAYDLTGDINLLSIDLFQGYDRITYNGDAISSVMAEGFYYLTIVTDGDTYYSEDFYVQCQSYLANSFPEPAFGGGLLADDNTEAIWNVYCAPLWFTACAVYSISDPGEPDDPGETTGDIVINRNDGTIYTWNGSAWIVSSPTFQYWYVQSTGSFLHWTGSEWEPSTPLTVDEDGACWTGVFGIPITVNIDSQVGGICTDVIERFRITVSGMTSGYIEVYGNGTSDLLLTITASGTYDVTDFVDNGYTLVLSPTNDFDGCVTGFEVFCPADLSNCQMKLAWTNCGKVGNIHYGDLVQNYYLPPDVIKPRAATKLVIEEVEGDDGTVTETSRRKEITYSVFLGSVPWYVADALTEMCLHDTVRLTHNGPDPIGSFPGFYRTDTLLHPRVEFQRDDKFSKCLVQATLTFELDNTSVACCDELDAPCATACVEAAGYDDDEDPEEDEYYLNPQAPTYKPFKDGVFGASLDCESGIANIEAGFDYYTVVWSVNDQQWNEVATNTQATASGDPCTVTLRWDVLAGYSAVLQYWSTDEIWVDDPDWDMSAEDWAANTLEREAPADQHEDNRLRLKVYIGDCVLGYSREIGYSCE